MPHHTERPDDRGRDHDEDSEDGCTPPKHRRHGDPQEHERHCTEHRELSIREDLEPAVLVVVGVRTRTEGGTLRKRICETLEFVEDLVLPLLSVETEDHEACVAVGRDDAPVEERIAFDLCPKRTLLFARGGDLSNEITHAHLALAHVLDVVVARKRMDHGSRRQDRGGLDLGVECHDLLDAAGRVGTHGALALESDDRVVVVDEDAIERCVLDGLGMIRLEVTLENRRHLRTDPQKGYGPKDHESGQNETCRLFAHRLLLWRTFKERLKRYESRLKVP